MPENVLMFPVERTRPPVEEKPITCMDCDNVAAGTRGLYCTYFNEFITFEEVAQECSEFEPI